MPLKQALSGRLVSKVIAGGGVARWGRIGILIFFVLTSSFAQTANPVITLDGSGTGHMFEGEGAMSAGASSRLLIDYPEPYRSQILDYLFKPNYGASFQDLKIELGGDMNSTTGSEPSHMHTRSDQNYNRGFEWWLMEQAKLRNPNITLALGILAWGAPGWIGNGQWFSQDAINYIVNYIQGAQTYHNLTINYVGILDERPYDPNWIIQLKAALLAQGLTTRIVAADQNSGQIINDVSANPALNAAVDVLGFHYPRFDGGPIPVSQPIWASEDGQAWSWNGNWPGAAYLAQAYIRPYINSKVTRHQVWSLVTSYYDMLMFPGSGQMYANTPWSGNYLVQPAIWATAHTNQFAGPGWQYIDSSSGFFGYGSYVTIRKGSDFSLIIENVNGPDTPLTFNIVNGLSTGALHVWQSNQTAQFIQQADIIPVNGSFSFTVAAGSIYSITTTTGQSKGNAVPPPAAPFPFPYADNFENASLSGQAKYFFDLNGSFEIVSCGGGRTGQCLRQAAPAPPIPWTTIGSIEASSVIGSTSWDNYQITADVFFEEPGTVKLMGRISGLNVNNGDMYGYELYVDNLGNWSLRQGNFVTLANGSVAFGAGAWHTLNMIFNGGTIGIVIDGVSVANVTTNDTYARGMAGLGVQSWTTAQFDNFRIDPIPGAGIPVPQSQMTATATGQTPGYEAAKAIDGNVSTFWNSPFTCVGGCAPTQPLPQSLTLALGGTYAVESVTYLPRQDNNQSGNITSYNVYVSADGTNFTTVASGNWAADATQKSASFTPTSASWVRLEAVSAIGGMAAASEVNVYYSPGSTATPPPDIDSLIPNFATAGGTGFTLSAAGNGFVPGSVVQWNGSNRTTTFVNSTALSAMIPATDLTSAGTAVVTVVNPAPGGGVSSGQTFTINSTGGTGGGSPPPAGTPFVTGYALGRQAVRNDFTGWVGTSLTVGASPLTVTALGRACLPGNSNSHTVKFVNAAGGTDVPGGSASVNMAGCTAGQFVYSSISPITLPVGGAWYLVSQETSGGDGWYDQGAVAATNVAAVNSAVYSYNGAWYPIGSANTSYVPPNFQYSAAAPTPITVNVAASPAGPSFSVDGTTYTTAQVFTWTSGSSHTIAAASPQNAGTGAQNVWSSWSDNGAISHTVAPTSGATYTASFTTQNQRLARGQWKRLSGRLLQQRHAGNAHRDAGFELHIRQLERKPDGNDKPDAHNHVGAADGDGELPVQRGAPATPGIRGFPDRICVKRSLAAQ
ncbi:MAG: discoidin domain-containing protein [Bryobacteraceae bacterium]